MNDEDNVKRMCAIYTDDDKARAVMLPFSLSLLARPSAARLALHPHISFRTKMTLPKPNTQPPKGAVIIHNVAKVASESDKFRRVLFTGKHSQVSKMA